METELDQAPDKEYLACEDKWTFWALILVAGIYGAYTYNLRGGVFCNAQTANFVLMSMELGRGRMLQAAYYLIPISAYLLGAVVSELLASKVKKIKLLRWDTLLVGFEIVCAFLLGLLPKSAPDQIVQVALNFICSMQYNTFRQFEGMPMATTFCTNHVRQIGINIVKCVKHKDKVALLRVKRHSSMILLFLFGATICTVACTTVGLKSIWLSCLILLVLFVRLIYADLVAEKGLLERTPKGHK